MFQRLRTISIVTFLATAILISACTKDVEPLSRAFRMGFTTLPYGSSEGSEDAYEKMPVESDIVNHCFDRGVPWVEALADDKFPDHILRDWSFRKERMKTPHKTYVSVTPINATHSGLALYRGTKDNMTLPSPWDQYTFSDNAVRTAYVNYCRRVIEFFQPDYFAMSIEANLFYKFKPDEWPRYLDFHEHVYRQLKAYYPDLPVFATIAGGPLLKGFVDDGDHVIQRLVAMQLLEMSDYYAISLYPPLAAFQTGTWPENTFHDLFSLGTKPVIIAETACIAEHSSVNTDQGVIDLAADPVKQKLFVDAMLAASDKWKAEFVIWLTLRDREPAVPRSNWPADYVSKNAGLYDDQGNPRPALNSWREWFKKRIDQ